MIEKLKNITLIFFSTFALSLNFVPATVHAQANPLKDGADSASGNAGKHPTTTINTVVKNIVNLISLIIGFVAVVMIIFAGFRYITSGGDSNQISSAKNTLLYAIIGLVIVALAQVIAQMTVKKFG